jgi:hypothetical protein
MKVRRLMMLFKHLSFHFAIFRLFFILFRVISQYFGSYLFCFALFRSISVPICFISLPFRFFSHVKSTVLHRCETCKKTPIFDSMRKKCCIRYASFRLKTENEQRTLPKHDKWS